MAAKVYGLGVFGLTAQTGIYTESLDYDFSIQEKWIADGDGDDVAGALFNPEVSFSLTGFVRSDESISTVLGSALVLANTLTMSEFIDGWSSGGIYLVNGAKRGFKEKDFRGLDLSGKFKPFMAAAA
tara:strand:- start:672 stop:1052 length:381 start_codon:yes stop_codon:yes gene_type:complete